MQRPTAAPLHARATVVAFAFGVLALAALPDAASAQASAYVPVTDAAYGRLDALITAGCVDTVVVGERPYSRSEFARMIREADGAALGACSVAADARLREDLAWLDARFAEELEAEPGQGAGRSVVRARALSADVTAVDSPFRPMHGGAQNEEVDADLNPLLQNNQGRILADGFTTGVEGSGDLVLGRHFAAQLRPRAWVLRPRGGSASADVTLLQGTARFVFGAASVGVGRNPVTLGHGVQGGPLLSANARGLDMIRVSMDRPARLPGFLRQLGLLKASLMAADMGQNRDTPGSNLYVLRVSNRIHPNLEVAFHFLNQQGGEGAPEAGNLVERVRDVLFPFLSRLENSDRVIGGDVRLRVPAIRTTLYLNGLTTDDRGWFRQSTGGLWEDAIWLGGGRVEGVGPEGRMDVWAEVRRSGVRPHTHGQFTSGLAVDRRVLGDAMGPQGLGIQAGLDWRRDENQVSFSGAWERYRGDELRWVIVEDPYDTFWELVEDNPDEERFRLDARWSHEPAVAGWSGAVRLGYERVTTWTFTEGATLDNFLLQVSFGHVF